jgi:hypothetical protein
MRSYVFETDFILADSYQKVVQHLKLIETMYAKELMRVIEKNFIGNASFIINDQCLDSKIVEDRLNKFSELYSDPFEPEYLDRLSYIVKNHVLVIKNDFITDLLEGKQPIVWINLLSSSSILVCVG